MNRRQAIARLGLGATGMLLAPRGVFARPAAPVDRLLDLAQRIREAPRGKVLDLAADAIGRGAGPRDLLGATFLAGVRDVRPQPVGGNLHSVMSVEASYRLAESAASREEAFLVALWNLDGFKATQREERGAQWVLPPAPTVSFPSEATARRELVAALEAWDAERADRAVVGLLPFHGREALYEVLWPYVARCMAYLGHKVVYGAMSEAVLRRLEWRYARPAARSLVSGLIGDGHTPLRTRAYGHALELAGAFPDGWLSGRGDDPEESLTILRALLAGDYRTAQRTVVDAARAGLSTRTIWDAIRLAAAELWLRRKSNAPESGEAIRAVHAVTEVWSLGHAWRTASLERNRRLLLLQAAAWIPELRDALVERDAISMAGPGIDRLGAEAAEAQNRPASLDELFEAGEPAAARVFLARRGDQAPAFRERLRRQVAPKGVEYHQFKYAVALEDESAPTHPRWIPYLLAPAVGYMPTRETADNELTARSRHALAKARV